MVTAEKKATKQVDLEGKAAIIPITGCLKVPKEKAYLETVSWTLTVPKEEVQVLVSVDSKEEVRQIVKEKLRMRKGASVPKGEFDMMVDFFTEKFMAGVIDHL